MLTRSFFGSPLLYACHLHFLTLLYLLFGIKLLAEAGMAEKGLNYFFLLARDGKEAWEDGHDRTSTGIFWGTCHYFRINLLLSQSRPCTTKEHSSFHCSVLFIARGMQSSISKALLQVFYTQKIYNLQAKATNQNHTDNLNSQIPAL